MKSYEGKEMSRWEEVSRGHGPTQVVSGGLELECLRGHEGAWAQSAFRSRSCPSCAEKSVPFLSRRIVLLCIFNLKYLLQIYKFANLCIIQIGCRRFNFSKIEGPIPAEDFFDTERIQVSRHISAENSKNDAA